MSTDAFVSIATSIAPSLVQSVAGKANPVSSSNDAKLLPQTAEQAPAPQQVVSKEQLQAAVQQIQKYLTDSQRTLEFHIDESSGTPVVTVRDANGEMIRQIPDAEALHIAQMLKDKGSWNHNLLHITA